MYSVCVRVLNADTFLKRDWSCLDYSIYRDLNP